MFSQARQPSRGMKCNVRKHAEVSGDDGRDCSSSGRRRGKWGNIWCIIEAATFTTNSLKSFLDIQWCECSRGQGPDINFSVCQCCDAVLGVLCMVASHPSPPFFIPSVVSLHDPSIILLYLFHSLLVSPFPSLPFILATDLLLRNYYLFPLTDQHPPFHMLIPYSTTAFSLTPLYLTVSYIIGSFSNTTIFPSSCHIALY